MLKLFNFLKKEKEDYSVDPNAFVTNTYKDKFLNIMFEHDNEQYIYEMFNQLLLEEETYVKGLNDAIYYCKELKTRNGSMAKQLKDYYFVNDND